jgi:hypothetical protein
LSTYAIGEAAVTSNDRPLSARAKVMITGQTLMAVETTVRKPAEPDALPEFEALSFLAESDNRASYFVTRNKWVFSQAPVIVEHR